MLLAIVNLVGIEKIVTFVVMLSVLVVLHELGHFIVARRNGVRVNEFAVGMGPKLLGWTSPRSGTLYSLRALPIGGYCAMQGEDGKTSEAEQQREFRGARQLEKDNFQAKSAWQRLAIVLAGPIANFLLCFLILVIGALVFGVAGEGNQPVVGMLVKGSAADVAGLRPGDRIVALDGVAVATNPNITFDPVNLGATTSNWFGRSQYPADPYLNGKLDEVRISCSAYSAAQIAALAK